MESFVRHFVYHHNLCYKFVKLYLSDVVADNLRFNGVSHPILN